MNTLTHTRNNYITYTIFVIKNVVCFLRHAITLRTELSFVEPAFWGRFAFAREGLFLLVICKVRLEYQ